MRHKISCYAVVGTVQKNVHPDRLFCWEGLCIAHGRAGADRIQKVIPGDPKGRLESTPIGEFTPPISLRTAGALHCVLYS